MSSKESEKVKKHICLGILAHVDAGKTTLSESCLLYTSFNDQCTGANPRYPLMKEIKELYLKCYYGK